MLSPSPPTSPAPAPARPGSGVAVGDDEGGFWPTLLRPLAPLPWVFFLVWTAVGTVVMPLGLGEAAIHNWVAERNAGLADAVSAVLRASDAVWIVLAATVVYLHTAAAEGLPTARRWAAIILLGSAAAEWVGARTGFPFGPYVYTDKFGVRLGGVLPFTIPLAWLVVALGGRYLVLHLRPAATRFELALGVATVGLLTDMNLEIIAWKERNYWLWYPDARGPVPAWPPWQNFASWFVLMWLLSCALPPNYRLRSARALVSAWRPVLVLGLMNALFLLVHAARWARFHFAR